MHGLLPGSGTGKLLFGLLFLCVGLMVLQSPANAASDPADGIHKSSAEYTKGNLQSAWTLYLENTDLLRPKEAGGSAPVSIRKLPINYSFWLVKRNMETGRAMDAETLIKELTIWSRQENGVLNSQQDAELSLLYADLAFLNGKLQTAQAWYRKVADSSEYKGTELHLRAGLGSVRVDIATKNHSAALDELEKLMRMASPAGRTKVHFVLAEVFMDQMDYQQALREIEVVLRAEPGYTDAEILKGKIQYQMRMFVDASEIEIGVTRTHKMIVPGERLKINLNDPSLSVSGASADIEVEVWTASGDKEKLLLHQLGDSRDKYRAEIETVLGNPVPGDKKLQVLGEDEIRYGYSKEFRSRMKDLPPDSDTVIGIISDAELYFSAGAFPPRKGERELDLNAVGLSLAQERLGLRTVRPGNPVYLRVIDPDQSKTAGIDRVVVSLDSSSGDSIRRLVLEETGPFTGEFEAIVPTASAQAIAFASDSAPGLDPNMVISPKSYDGWFGARESKLQNRIFGVDLNDKVAVDRMSIKWVLPGRPLTRFRIETSLNGEQWTTQLCYPGPDVYSKEHRPSNENKTTFEKAEDGVTVTFDDTIDTRLIRLVIDKYEGREPAIKKIELTDRKGKKILPVRDDYKSLRDNTQLELLPGDSIVARYKDPRSASPNRSQHEDSISVAFNNASVMASFIDYKTSSKGRELSLERIWRFRLGDAVAFVIDDFDMDSSPARDVVEFKVITSEGKETTLKAVETEAHSGRFIGRFFPVAGKPERKSELQVPEGGTVRLVYRDEENLTPGIPADRSVSIQHAKYMTPEMGVYTVSSKLVDAAEKPPKDATSKDAKGEQHPDNGAAMQARTLAYTYVKESDREGAQLVSVIDGRVVFDVVATHMALAQSSKIFAYAQVRGDPPKQGQAFDVTRPGTLKLTGTLTKLGSKFGVPEGYRDEGVRGPEGGSGVGPGRFVFSVPLLLGNPPGRSFATEDAEDLPAGSIPPGLYIKDGDVVDVGFAYKDEKEQLQWKTASVTVGSHSFLKVLDSGYREPLRRVFVGERVFVSVLARALDKGPARDIANVKLKTDSGVAVDFKLRETEPHSGLFRGMFRVNYADKDISGQLPPVELNGLPVKYGDQVVVTYDPVEDAPAQSITVNINTGSDGAVEPFSKRYTGGEMAVKTSFTLSECFFEQAKIHRKMGPEHESLARREIEHARKLLQEAIATHQDDNLRAHAEYLLGNLAQEYADLAKNDASKLPMYQDALARFKTIPADYPDTEFAPKAQFKIGLVYEKMGEHTIASEEYVKLAYKYPDCDYIPEAMSRLGGYFQSRGQAYKEQADPLREKNDVHSKSEVIKLDEFSYPEFIKAAIIFDKLQERFPNDELAGLAGLRAGQNYMRAHQYDNAISLFRKVMDNETYDGIDIRAQAMYWCGLCYERLTAPLGDTRLGREKRRLIMTEAHSFYQRVTFDFPDSKWAKYARGRLADPALAQAIGDARADSGRKLDALKKSRAKLKEQMKEME